MANFDIAIPKTLKKEGGSKYTNVSGDRGGETKFGITKAAYPELNIKSLTEDDAKAIYKRDYWDKVYGDQITSQLIAENIFDTSVNMGVKTSIKLAQTVLGFSPKDVDGIIGKKTISALNKCSEKMFISAYTLAKIARYAGICNNDKTQTKFLLGWLNRALGE